VKIAFGRAGGLVKGNSSMTLPPAVVSRTFGGNLRREPHSKEERQKLFGVPTLIGTDLTGHVQVTVRLDDGAAAVERIFGVKRI